MARKAFCKIGTGHGLLQLETLGQEVETIMTNRGLVIGQYTDGVIERKRKYVAFPNVRPEILEELDAKLEALKKVQQPPAIVQI